MFRFPEMPSMPKMPEMPKMPGERAHEQRMKYLLIVGVVVVSGLALLMRGKKK
ncbi:hypothetical protein [Oceanospirillum sediminis]|uniref:Uncharacterized protein n=1 Tax=Oceanospirillum sediminis TaxID=2760088 RepID=A0A839ILT2_9GAMM|nr:hypothetical protein [Oceanospirillum sediminis]MBB1485918.1 hypothetical protein [Oceanospirillum sediminis]